MTIRPGHPNDATSLAALFAAFYAEADRAAPTMRAEFIIRDGLSANPHFTVLVAEEPDGTLVGFAFWCPTYDTDLVGPGGHLLDLYVTPSHRRQGFGRALMAACARDVHTNGGHFLTWNTDPNNAAAHGLYAPLGRTTEPLTTFVADGAFLEQLASQA